MAKTPSNMIDLKTKAASFLLPDAVSGEMLALEEIKGTKATVIMFICNHCPFVVHVKDELVKLSNDYIPHGVSFIAISSNDVENYPDDSPQKMKELALENKFQFPYLYDESQEVAKSYEAACTPDFYIYNDNLELVYRGQLDDSRPGSETTVTGKDMRAALDAIISKNPVSEVQKPSLGCNIKWKQQ